MILAFYRRLAMDGVPHARHLFDAFNPDQPREENGQWAGLGTSKTEHEAYASNHSERAEKASSGSKRVDETRASRMHKRAASMIEKATNEPSSVNRIAAERASLEAHEASGFTSLKTSQRFTAKLWSKEPSAISNLRSLGTSHKEIESIAKSRLTTPRFVFPESDA